MAVNRATHFGTLQRGNAVYVGGLKDGLRHGTGELRYADGRTYVGDFVMDRAEGHGTYTCPDGTKYVGGFVANKRHGLGVYSRSDGQVLHSPTCSLFALIRFLLSFSALYSLSPYLFISFFFLFRVCNHLALLFTGF